jgi:phosphatidylglycerophosphate synthase
LEKPAERRPITAREHPASQAVARFLAARNVSANAISIAGLVCALVAGVLLSTTHAGSVWSWIAAALLIEIRLLCNMFDGMVALHVGTGTRLGEVLNEVPDRLSDAAVLIGLGYAAGGSVWLGFAAALAAVFTAYVRVVGTSMGLPTDFRGAMGKPHRMHAAAITAIVCAAAAGLGYRFDEAEMGIAALGLVIIGLGTIGTAIGRLGRLIRCVR